MLGAITGGTTEEMKAIAKTYLDNRLNKICEGFERLYLTDKKKVIR